MSSGGELTLTSDQRKAINLMENGGNVFVMGPGGTGKSLLLDVYYRNAVKYYGQDRVYKTSTTGVSAILIDDLLKLAEKKLVFWKGKA